MQYDFEPPKRQGRQEHPIYQISKLGVLGVLAVNFFFGGRQGLRANGQGRYIYIYVARNETRLT
jgi:hypothetical protein